MKRRSPRRASAAHLRPGALYGRERADGDSGERKEGGSRRVSSHALASTASRWRSGRRRPRGARRRPLTDVRQSQQRARLQELRRLMHRACEEEGEDFDEAINLLFARREGAALHDKAWKVLRVHGAERLQESAVSHAIKEHLRELSKEPLAKFAADCKMDRLRLHQLLMELGVAFNFDGQELQDFAVEEDDDTSDDKADGDECDVLPPFKKRKIA
eukprot:PLAT15225.3.p1 GENE.PLAT15225.3~~PLAT15225.3.p1  ORF type:complete len:216 (+),score=70.56 PLAT15225.3:69-716(+)